MAFSKSWMYLSHDDMDHQLAHLASGLGHPERIKIIRQLISDGSAKPTELWRASPLSLSTVSHHLKMLHERHWVSCRTHGRHVEYTLNPGVCLMFRDLLTTLLDEVEGLDDPDLQGE